MLLQLVVVWNSARVVLGKRPERRKEGKRKVTSTPIVKRAALGPADPFFQPGDLCAVHVWERRGKEGENDTPFPTKGNMAKGLLPSAGSREGALEGSSGPCTSLMARTHPPKGINSRGHLHQTGQHHLVA